MQRALVAFFLLACASNPSAPAGVSEETTTELRSAPPGSSAPPETVPSDAAPPEAAPQQPHQSGASVSPPAQAAAQSPETKLGPGPQPHQSLAASATKVRNIGLHVGGGANDSASKRPFLRAVERQFPEFLQCYQLISEPGLEGTFGVDIQVPKAGGKAKVEEPRTALPGEEFLACMVKAFEAVTFEPTAKPVVISYSLRFYSKEGARR